MKIQIIALGFSGGGLSQLGLAFSAIAAMVMLSSPTQANESLIELEQSLKRAHIAKLTLLERNWGGALVQPTTGGWAGPFVAMEAFRERVKMRFQHLKRLDPTHDARADFDLRLFSFVGRKHPQQKMAYTPGVICTSATFLFSKTRYALQGDRSEFTPEMISAFDEYAAIYNQTMLTSRNKFVNYFQGCEPSR